MKAKLIFNLPEDNQDFEQAKNGSKLYSAIWDFDQDLRAKYKYNNIESMDLYKVRDLLREKLSEYNLSLE